MVDTKFSNPAGIPDEAYDGNEPICKGHELISGGYADKWLTRYGGGETANGEILYFSFNLNRKINIFICGDLLNILDFRYSDKFDEWYYCNKPDMAIHGTFVKKNQHPLEKEKIDHILNSKIPNCKIWEIVSKSARNLYDQSIDQT